MRKYITVQILVCLLLLAPLAGAQTQNDKSWWQRTIHYIGETIDEIAVDGVDTNYLVLPRYGWQAGLTCNFAGILAEVKGENIPTYGGINVDLTSKLSGQTSFSLGYRFLSFDYSLDIANGYSNDFNLSWLDNTWGIEYRSHSTEGLHGTLDATATDGSLDVKEGDTRLRATLINGYYVFNSSRYSLPAAMEQALVQRQSAGSVTVYALGLSAKLEAQDATLRNMLGGMNSMEFYQAALGIGYGYNYTPNQGRLLLHASASPLLMFFNKSLVGIHMGIPLPDGTTYYTDINKEVKAKHKVFLTGVARASLFWYINDHFLIGCAALINNIRFTSDTDLGIRMNDWIINATFGVRF